MKDAGYEEKLETASKDLYSTYNAANEGKTDQAAVNKEIADQANQAERKSTRSSRRSAHPAIGELLDDLETYLIYPPEEDGPDPITVCKGDLRRLEPPEYLNDNLIDLKIKYVINQLDPITRKKVHAFSW